MRRTSKLPLEKLQGYLLSLPSLQKSAPENEPTPGLAPTQGYVDFSAIFGNDHPVEIEVGFGKGLFLASAAQAHPEINYLGIEIERTFQLLTANRLAKANLSNVRLVCTDARAFLRDRLADRSLHGLHVYFPDPWWKRRHHKRRLFNAEFACQCARLLQPGGKLHVVSDVAEYFVSIQKLIAGQTDLRSLPLPELKEPSHDLDYLTNFERKYRKEGRPIYRAMYERVQD